MELLSGYSSSSSSDSAPSQKAGGRKRRLSGSSPNPANGSTAQEPAARTNAESKQHRSSKSTTDRFSGTGASALTSILDSLPDMQLPENTAQGPSMPSSQASAAAPVDRAAAKSAPPSSVAARRAQQQQQHWQSIQSSSASHSAPTAAAAGGGVQGTPQQPQQHGAAQTALPGWANRLDKRTARELASLGMLPAGGGSGGGGPPSADVAGGITQPAVADVDSQALYGKWDSQAALKGSLAVPDKRNVTIGYWNAHGEGATTTSAPTRGQKRKNQVNHVAAHFFRNENNYQAADAAAAAHKRSSRSKYGW